MEKEYANAKGTDFLELKGCRRHNLKGFDARMMLGGFNVVTGVAGAGKSTLVQHVLREVVGAHLEGREMDVEGLKGVEGLEGVDKMVVIDQKPIGRTPRSNPATYTGLATRVRDIFAKTEAAKAAGFKKGRFSFNNKGGRCETCQGAGRLQIGMHLLGNVDIPCHVCEGRRFNAETLEIKYRGKSIFEVLELRVDAAFDFFEGEKAIRHQLQILKDVGLGYLQLGQASTTLSGGEAQRVKLATELQQKATGKTLYLLAEPTIGLHPADVEVLLKALRKLQAGGNTIVCIEHDLDIIS
ncbi:MAG: hypothetical protein AAF570_27720, partial [Bacteroidota bacterium]